MKVVSRLTQMKKYLKEAKSNPTGNELYIDDLELSIEHFEKIVQSENNYAVFHGAVDTLKD